MAGWQRLLEPGAGTKRKKKEGVVRRGGGDHRLLPSLAACWETRHVWHAWLVDSGAFNPVLLLEKGRWKPSRTLAAEMRRPQPGNAGACLRINGGGTRAMEWPNEADGHGQLAMNDVGRIEPYIDMRNTQARLVTCFGD